MDAPINLLGLTRAQLEQQVQAWGNKPFRAGQLFQWVHQRGQSDFSKMTDLAQSFRQMLEHQAVVQAPSLVRESTSHDGTKKWLLQVSAQNAIETVFIPESDRGTLCVSTQVGCALACTFCATGRQGFNRNLTTAEIIAQIWWAYRALGMTPKGERVISNVVFMGMGEPLLNLEALIPAIHILLDDKAYGLSRRRVTVSTSGVIPGLNRLAQEAPVALAVSLHAPTDSLRDELVPINQKYPLAQLMQGIREYLLVAPRDFVTFEYVMLKDVNDRLSDAQHLVDCVSGVSCKFNLIPFNPFPQSGYECSLVERIAMFKKYLQEAGFVVTVRKTRGEDIEAACGQLAGEFEDKSRRYRRFSEGEVV